MLKPLLLNVLPGDAVSEAELIALILSFPQAEQSSHFGHTDFRARGKIFASHPEPERLVLKLSVEQQELLVETAGEAFAKLPNKWGGKGWTSAAIPALDDATARSALQMAWINVAPKSLARSQ
ncbi:MAG: MmcQ/YjbR family DNA-binding protein [Devosia sp.]|nr:MmcQ/YjbR family DNA-binding protein [Devosia sp.]